MLPWLVLLAGVALLQFASGAGRYVPTDPDEPAHFISGLAVRDYLASGLGAAPLEYGRNYYSHYPKLAIGNWPPVFYALQGVWMLVFPAGTRTVLALIGLLAASTAWIVFRTLSRELGEEYGWLGAGVLLLLPPLSSYASSIMTELPLTFFTTLALWSWAWYLATRRAVAALGFAAASATAVLTKGSALDLVLLPVLTVAIGKHWWVLRSRVLWGAAGAIALIAGPWTWRNLDTVRAGWASATFSGEYAVRALGYYAGHLASALGPVLLVLAGIGVWRSWDALRSSVPIFSSSAALVIAVILFHSLIPSGTTRRHLIVSYPALAMLVALGAQEVVRVLGRRGVQPRFVLLGIGVASVVFLVPRQLHPPKRNLGELAHAAAVVAGADAADGARVSLIVSDALGEGIYVQEAAVRDARRPHDTVWRGSKLMSSATWGGTNYRLRVETPEEVLALLDQASIQAVVFDRTAPSPHATLLDRTIASFPERFTLRARLALTRADRQVSDAVLIYRYHPGEARQPRLRQIPGYEGVEEYVVPAKAR